ncbi:MAG: hypothetical protein AAFO97_15135 [Pseudomonadota bacterium]
MNSADGVVVHALGAINNQRIRKARDIKWFADILRQALPHTSDHIPHLQPLLSVAVELIDKNPVYFDGSPWFAGWSLRVSDALQQYHQLTCAEFQERMQDALNRRVA